MQATVYNNGEKMQATVCNNGEKMQATVYNNGEKMQATVCNNGEKPGEKKRRRCRISNYNESAISGMDTSQKVFTLTNHIKRFCFCGNFE